MSTELAKVASLFRAEDGSARGLALRILEPLFEQDMEELRNFARRCELARAVAITHPQLLVKEAELVDCLRRLVWAVRNLRCR